MTKTHYNFDKNMKLNEDLCEFLGAFIGDGFYNTYQSGKYITQFTGDFKLDYQYYKENIIPKGAKNFDNIKPKLRKKKGINALIINYQSKNIFYMLKERFKFPIGKKNNSVIIPKEIINSKDKKFLYATIRGIFDTDGGVFFDNRKPYKTPYPRITLKIASKPLFKQIKTILKTEFKLCIYKKKNKNGKEYDELIIYGHKQLNKWMQLIGFSNPRHLKKIKASGEI